jgi:SAM-dependent methyltransferase
VKERLLQWLACPECLGALELRDPVREGEEIREGALACRGCAALYPVRDFIPRFVQTDRYVDTFSFEWNVFHDVQIDILNKTSASEETFVGKTGFTKEQAAGRLFLDAGVGAGRFAEVVSRWGGEVVGFDLSYAVDAAFGNVGRRPNVHLVQADIFKPPFRPATFDHGYSIGVLHHTPDTRAAFEKVVPLVKPGGGVAIFVYERAPSAHFSDRWRKLTVRLPRRVNYVLAAAAIPLYWVYRLPLVGGFLQLVAPIAMWPHWRWRWLDTFDWYTPKYQWKHTYPEVYGWFRENGLKDVEIFEHPICMRGFRT